MKYIKILGLAAVAAMALMAFVGAGSASATVLCKETPTGTNPAVCPAGKTYAVNDVIEGAVQQPALLTNDLENVECATSTTRSKVTNAGGTNSTVLGTIESLTFGGCKTEVTKATCTVTVENLPYLAEVHWTSGTHDGTLTAKNDGSGEPGAKVTCVGVLICKFSAEPTLDIHGGSPASVEASEEPLGIHGGFLEAVCPTEAFWDATYVATGTNTAVWVAKE